MSFGRLVRALIAAAVIAAAAASTAGAARAPVLVIKHKSVRLLAWDRGGKVCTQLIGARQRSSNCGAPRGLSFEQFPSGVSNATLVGGSVTSRAVAVEVLFADGAKLRLHAVAGKRYHGRRHRMVRFFAGWEPSITTVRSLTALDRDGKTVKVLDVGTPAPVPGPTPGPTPGPPPCQCPPLQGRACPAVTCL